MKKQTLLTIIAGGLLVLLLAGCGAIAFENPFAMGDSKEPEEERGYSLGLTLTPGDGQLLVSWNAYDGAEFYEVWFGTTNEIASAELVQDTMDADNTDTTCTITGLINEQEYFVWVYPSVTGEKKLVDQTPVSATPVGEYSLGLVLGAADSQITASWNVHDQADSYEVRYSTVDDWENATTVSYITTSSYTILNLNNGQLYYVWVFPIVDGVRQLENQIPLTETPAEATTPPAAPDATAAADGFNGMLVSWTPVSGAISYRLSWVINSEPEQGATTSSTNYTISGLSPSDNVQITVYAVNGVGDSPANNLGTVAYTFNVTNLQITANNVASNGTLDISWNAVPGADHYTVIISPNNAVSTTIFSSSSTTYPLDFKDTTVNTQLFNPESINASDAGEEFSFVNAPAGNSLKIEVMAFNSGSDFFSTVSPESFSIDLGDGSAATPNLIFHEKDLRRMDDTNDLRTQSYKLMKDIELTSEWEPLAPSGWNFLGNLNGNNKIISGLNIVNPSTNNIGFFSALNGEVKDLTIQIVAISTTTPETTNAGGLAGSAYSATLIDNCVITNDPDAASPVIATCVTSGGLIGNADAVQILNCSNDVTIGNGSLIDGASIGGLAGIYRGQDETPITENIYNSNASCRIVGSEMTSTATGGLIGTMDVIDTSTLTISNCYYSGDQISGYNKIGGLIGQIWPTNFTSSSIIIENSYVDTPQISTSALATNSSEIGGFIGFVHVQTADMLDLQISNCFVDNSDDVSPVDGLNDGTEILIAANNAQDIGGFIGSIESDINNANSFISECYANIHISGNTGTAYNIGGLIGSSNIDVRECFTTGSITCSTTGGTTMGGISGQHLGSSSEISNCYSTITIIGYNGIGGITGSNFGFVSYCLSSGNISGNNYIGGIVGESGSGQLSYNLSMIQDLWATGSYVRRIIGWDMSMGTSLSNDYGLTNMRLQNSVPAWINADAFDGNNGTDGFDYDSANFNNPANLPLNGWNFNPDTDPEWIFAIGVGPILRAFRAEDGWTTNKPNGWITPTQDPVLWLN